MSSPQMAVLKPKNNQLTAREKQVLDLVKDGYSNHNVAVMLGININTVKHHLMRVFDKTGCDSRLQLALQHSGIAGEATRKRELNLERAELAGRLATINEQLALLGGAPDEEKAPVLDFGHDFAARAGIACILADYASGHPDVAQGRD